MSDVPIDRAELLRRWSSHVVVLMPDSGVFPLWSGGALAPPDAIEGLGLDQDLVDEILRWGWENASIVPRGHADWLAWGADLHRRIQSALGPDWDVEYRPTD